MATPKTNTFGGPGCAPDACASENPSTILGPTSSTNTGQICVEEGFYQVISLFSAPTGTTVTFERVDSRECGTGLSVPYTPCPGKLFQLDDGVKSAILAVPGCYKVKSSAAIGLSVVAAEQFNIGEQDVIELTASNCHSPSVIVTPPIPPAPVYCPSLALPECGGFIYQNGDSRDPAATVVLNDCATPPVPIGYLYPAAAPGRTIPVSDCSGVVIGYAQNRSECAPICNQSSGGGTPGAPGTNGTNGIDGTNGLDGAKGDKGDKGDSGVNGTNGTNGADATVTCATVKAVFAAPGVASKILGYDAAGNCINTDMPTVSPSSSINVKGDDTAGSFVMGSGDTLTIDAIQGAVGSAPSVTHVAGTKTVVVSYPAPAPQTPVDCATVSALFSAPASLTSIFGKDSAGTCKNTVPVAMNFTGPGQTTTVDGSGNVTVNIPGSAALVCPDASVVAADLCPNEVITVLDASCQPRRVRLPKCPTVTLSNLPLAGTAVLSAAIDAAFAAGGGGAAKPVPTVLFTNNGGQDSNSTLGTADNQYPVTVPGLTVGKTYVFQLTEKTTNFSNGAALTAAATVLSASSGTFTQISTTGSFTQYGTAFYSRDTIFTFVAAAAAVDVIFQSSRVAGGSSNVGRNDFALTVYDPNGTVSVTSQRSAGAGNQFEVGFGTNSYYPYSDGTVKPPNNTQMVLVGSRHVQNSTAGNFIDQGPVFNYDPAPHTQLTSATYHAYQIHGVQASYFCNLAQAAFVDADVVTTPTPFFVPTHDNVADDTNNSAVTYLMIAPATTPGGSGSLGLVDFTLNVAPVAGCCNTEVDALAGYQQAVVTAIAGNSWRFKSEFGGQVIYTDVVGPVINKTITLPTIHDFDVAAYTSPVKVTLERITYATDPSNAVVLSAGKVKLKVVSQ